MGHRITIRRLGSCQLGFPCLLVLYRKLDENDNDMPLLGDGQCLRAADRSQLECNGDTARGRFFLLPARWRGKSRREVGVGHRITIRRLVGLPLMPCFENPLAFKIFGVDTHREHVTHRALPARKRGEKRPANGKTERTSTPSRNTIRRRLQLAAATISNPQTPRRRAQSIRRP